MQKPIEVISRFKSALRGYGLAAVLLCMIVGPTVARLIRMHTSEPPSPPIDAPPESLHFGTAWAQPAFQWDVPIKNKTDRDISITRFATSCTCTLVDPPSLFLPPHTTAVVSLTLDLTKAANGDESEFTVQVVPQFSGSQREVTPTWLFRGIVRRPLLMVPTEISYTGADRIVRGKSAGTKHVRIIPQLELLRLDIRCNSDIMQTRLETPAAHSSEYLLSITPTTSLPNGPFTANIDIVAVLPNGESLPAVVLSVMGVVEPDARPIPSIVTLFAEDLQSVHDVPLILLSQTGSPFYVIEARSKQGLIQVAGIQPEERTHHELDVAFNAKAYGTINESIFVTVCSARDQSLETIEIPVRGYVGPVQVRNRSSP